MTVPDAIKNNSPEQPSDPWEHDHCFGQDQKKPGEARTLVVIALTAGMMVIEMAAGWAFGSMALLADGLHMASHAAALSISAFAYYFARKRAHDRSFTFGTGKVNSLGGFTGAVLLVLFGLFMVTESLHRLVDPVPISFNQAIAVAIVGLIVNGVSVFVLGHDGHDHHHGHDDDLNLRAAYLHVLADTLTSVLAIFALLAAKYYGWVWMDPIMGVVGAVLITKWSIGLLRQSGSVLLDQQGPSHLVKKITNRLTESPCGSQVVDLHVWSIGPNIFSTAIVVLSDQPQVLVPIKEALKDIPEIVHSTVEVHPTLQRDSEPGETPGNDFH